MQHLKFKNKWVLITGASSGLGYEMASQLANRWQANLVLTARRLDRLEALKAKLEKEAGVQIKIISADLSQPANIDPLIDEVLTEVELYGAILNAGITYFGRNTDMTAKQFNDLLQTNVVSTSRITNRIVNYFEKNNSEGALMLISSMAGVYPVPFQAAYSASKAFTISFASALSYELKNRNFSITVFAPGGVETEMTSIQQFDSLKKWLMPVSVAAWEAISCFRKRRHLYLPGLTNKLGYVLMKFLPRKIVAAQLGRIYRNALTLYESKNMK